MRVVLGGGWRATSGHRSRRDRWPARRLITASDQNVAPGHNPFGWRARARSAPVRSLRRRPGRGRRGPREFDLGGQEKGARERYALQAGIIHLVFRELLQELLRVPGANFCCIADGAMGKVLASAGAEADGGPGVPLAVLGWGATAAGYLAAAANDELDDLIVTSRRAYHLVRQLEGEAGQPLLIYMRLERPRANLAVGRRALATVEVAPKPVPHPRGSAPDRETPDQRGSSSNGRGAAVAVAAPVATRTTVPPPAPGGGPAAAPPTHGAGPGRHPGEPGTGAGRAAEPAAPAHRGGAATRGTWAQPAVPDGAPMGRRRQHDATPAHGATATEIRISARHCRFDYGQKDPVELCFGLPDHRCGRIPRISALSRALEAQKS